MPHPHTDGAPGSGRIIAIASSAGGLHALTAVLEALPASFGAPIVIVQHLDPHHPSHLAGILARRTKVSVKQAEEGDRLQAGMVYIAPPDRHVIVNPDDTVSLSQSEMVHFLRPSADLLFESLAASSGARAVAVVLSGGGSDGSMGLQAIKKKGGLVIAQDPSSCEFPGMPTKAIQTGQVDRIVPLREMASALVTCTKEGEVS